MRTSLEYRALPLTLVMMVFGTYFCQVIQPEMGKSPKILDAWVQSKNSRKKERKVRILWHIRQSAKSINRAESQHRSLVLATSRCFGELKFRPFRDSDQQSGEKIQNRKMHKPTKPYTTQQISKIAAANVHAKPER